MIAQGRVAAVNVAAAVLLALASVSATDRESVASQRGWIAVAVVAVVVTLAADAGAILALRRRLRERRP